MSQAPPLYVFIVGIDKWLWEDMPPLKGAVNDALLMKRVFQERFAVPDENMTTLINEQATRENIVTSFRTELIDRAKAWQASDTDDPSPAFVFLYAGHGSRNTDPTGTQPDGKDETIVPYDSRLGDVYDIKDWEIAGWLDELTSITDNVTVIMDCCHSGSGTRSTEEDLGTPRICENDERPQQAGRPIEITNDESTNKPSKPENSPKNKLSLKTKATKIESGTRNTSAVSKPNRYVLLAACRNFELAKEYTVRGEENKRKDVKNYKQGAFTWFLAQELMSLPPGQQITYHELFERTRFQVHQQYRSQMPQCEGDRDRVLFGGARIVSDPLVTVTEAGKRGILIDAGAVHGVSVGAELNVYPPGTRTVDDDTQPIAKLKVVQTQPARSRCEVDGDETIEALSKAAFIGSASRLEPHKVYIEISDQSLAKSILDRLTEDDLATYVNVVDDIESAKFIVGRKRDALTIRDCTGKLIVKPANEDTPRESLELLASNVAAICRYHNVLALKNDDKSSALRGKISIEFHEVIDDEDDSDWDESEQSDGRNILDIRPIKRTAEGFPISELGQRVAFEITNHSKLPVYIEALSFGWDFAIVPLTEALCGEGVRKRVEPGGTLWLGREAEEYLAVDLLDEDGEPIDEELYRQFTEVTEPLKIVATTDEPNFRVLKQAGLAMPVDSDDEEEDDGATRSAGSSALDELFGQAMQGTRAFGTKRKKRKTRDWTTVDRQVVVRKPPKDLQQRVSAGEEVELDQYEVKIKTPSNVSCNVSVMTETETCRSTAAGTSEFPSGSLFDSPFVERASLLPRGTTNPDGAAINITADSQDFKNLSAENPLTLSVGGDGDDRPLVAFAWDGQCAVPVSVSNDSDLQIPWLPSQQVTSDQNGEEIEEGSRGLLNTVKLYLYRVAKMEHSSLGLHSIRHVPRDQIVGSSLSTNERCEGVADGEMRYREIQPGDIAAKSRVALLVHGFASESKAILSELNSLIGEQLSQYDTTIAFDYDSFSTPLGESGKKLADGLKAAGFSDTDDIQIDVFAQGTGALVARSAIEMHDAAPMIDRCFFAGPPSAGSDLLIGKVAIPYLATAVLNLALPGAAATMLKFLTRGIKYLDADASAIADLVPKSEFLKSLDAAGKPDSVTYNILAGDYDPSRAADRWYSAFAKMADTGLDWLFKDKHDLFANTASITKVSGKNIDIRRVTCHHFGYFHDEGSGQILKTWLTQS